MEVKMRRHSYNDYEFELGQKIDDIEIIRDNFSFIEGRYVVEFLCKCGKVDYKRIDKLKSMTYMSCKYCSRKNEYPDKRKSKGLFEYNIHKQWLINLNENLTRGKRVLESTITMLDLKNKLIEQNYKCAYTGKNLDVLNIFKQNSNASIDRISSEIGYLPNNIQWVYKPVNIMKNKFSEEEFIYVCKMVAKFKDNPELSHVGTHEKCND